MIIKDRAIILRRYPYSETSYVLTCLTPRYGKMQLLAKGAKRHRSRFFASLDFLNYGVLIASSRSRSELDILRDFDHAETFRDLLHSMRHYYAANFIAEAASLFAMERDEYTRIFNLFLLSLRSLSKGDSPSAAVLSFSFQVLAASGFGPNISECTSCRKVFDVFGHFSMRHGGVLCGACRGNDPDVMPIRPETFHVLKGLDNRLSSTRLDQESFSKDAGLKTFKLLAQMLSHVSGKDLLAVALTEQIFLR